MSGQKQTRQEKEERKERADLYSYHGYAQLFQVTVTQLPECIHVYLLKSQ